jgi:apolipoprotein N-acyltransferase
MNSKLKLAVLFGAGAVSACGFEPLGLWPLTLAAIALLIREIELAPTRRGAFLRGMLFGAGHFLVGLNWIVTAFTYQAAMPAWVGIAAEALLSIYLAVFTGLAALVSWHRSAWRRRGLALVLIFAAAWMFLEWLRSTLFTGFAWGPLAATSIPGLVHAGAWIGTYGLSGLVVLAGGALWLAVSRKVIHAGVLVAVVVVLPLGAWLLEPSQTVGAGIPVRIVQPNIHQDEKYDLTLAEKHARIYEKLSGPPTGKRRLLLWPEAATLRFLDIEPKARAELATLLGPEDLLILGGEAVDIDPEGRAPDRYYNSVFALDSAGTLRWRYEKSHLVPFGEYLPLRPILSKIGIARLVPGDGDFMHGPGPHTFDVPGFGTIGVQICYEIIFSGEVIDEDHRPAFLFNPSNDAWFGSWGPPQHFAQARLRAIEEGIPVVRATPTGISGVISPVGKVLATMPRDQAGVIDAVIPPPRSPTLFARLGLWVSAMFAVMLGLAGLILRARENHGRG